MTSDLLTTHFRTVRHGFSTLPGYALVVSRSTSTRRTTRELLEFCAATTFEAASGVAAFQDARVTNPSVILCDGAMPLSEAFTLLHTIRSNEATASIPFVMMFPSPLTQEKRERCMELGADACIATPATPLQIAVALKPWLTRNIDA